MKKSKFSKIIFLFFIMVILNISYVNAITIVLDPGHGGPDSGAIASDNKTYEKDVTFKIAKFLKAYLEQYKDVNVILTHNGNLTEKLEIYDRAMIARKNKANLLVSLHINSSTSNSDSGAEVFVTANTSLDKYNKQMTSLGNKVLANLQNIGIKNFRGSVQTKLIPKDTTDVYNDGTRADYYGIIRYAMRGTKIDYGVVSPEGAVSANVQKGEGVPAILIEHCFIKGTDFNYINSDDKIKKLALADANAIVEQYGLKKKEETPTPSATATPNVTPTTKPTSNSNQGIDYTKVTGNFSENNMIDYGLMVTGDFNGDGVDDVATMYSYGGNLSRILVNTSNKTSLNKEEIWYASNSYDAKRVVGKFVAGDFNGDGKEDIVAMCDYGNNVMKIHVWISTGKQFKEEVTWFSSNQYNAEKISERIVSGDFNGDGKEDIAAMYDYGNLVTRTHVWLSTGEKFKNEEHWFMSNQYIANRINQRIVSGDFNGDGKEDIAAVYDYGNLKVRTHVWLSTGSKFANEEHWFMSNQYIAERITARLTAGDVDGDGKDDLVAMYDYKNANTAIHIWKSTGSKFANEEHWFVSGIGNYIAERVSKVTTGDFNGDGKADIAAIYSYGKPKKSIHLWKSTGKTLNKMEIW